MGAEQSQESSVKRFASPPGYTQIPNVLIDEVMPDITTLAELKVTMAIARETFGWQREERRLGLDEIMKLTKLSRTSAQAGVTAGLARGYLGRRREGHGFVYGLRVASAKNVDSSPSSEESTSLTQLSSDSGPPSNKGKKTLRGKENSNGADAPSAAKEGDIKGKPGSTFKPNPEDKVHQVIVELFDFWVANTPQPPGTTLTVNRAQQIKARMREQAEGVDRGVALATARERMLEGLKGWVGSEWHREREAFDFDVLFRSRKKVEKFRGDFFRTQQAEAKKQGGATDFSGYEGVVERG